MTYYQASQRLGVMLATASSEADKEALRVARRRLLKAMEDEPVKPTFFMEDEIERIFCPKCNAKLEGFESYCWHCGAELDWEK